MYAYWLTFGENLGILWLSNFLGGFVLKCSLIGLSVIPIDDQLTDGGCILPDGGCILPDGGKISDGGH